MADPGHLTELQRKFEENPRRYFAPLASEFRKAGDPERAIALCRTYLIEQPGHMSGYVIYGQALFDAGYRREAVEAFEQALALDPENMIAMRYLGDLAREGGDLDRATHWYRRLLDLDPRDEVLSSYLAELASQEPPAVDSPVPARDAPESRGEERAESYAPVETASADTTSVEGDQVFEVAEELLTELPARATPLAGTPTPFEEVHQPPEISSGETEPRLESEVTGKELFAPHEPLLSEPISPEAAMAWAEMVDPSIEMPEPAGSLEPLAAVDVAVPTAPLQPQASSGEPAHEESAQAEPVGEVQREAPAGEAAREEPSGEEPTTEASIAEAPVPEDAGRRGSAYAPFVTETMATLYLRQGFTARALEVYRQLAVLRPEPRLQDKIRELEEMLAAETISVRDFFVRIGALRPTTAAGPPVVPASGVGALFADAPSDERDARAAAALANAYPPSR